jgi:hypothetical protein
MSIKYLVNGLWHTATLPSSKRNERDITEYLGLRFGDIQQCINAETLQVLFNDNVRKNCAYGF